MVPRHIRGRSSCKRRPGSRLVGRTPRYIGYVREGEGEMKEGWNGLEIKPSFRLKAEWLRIRHFDQHFPHVSSQISMNDSVTAETLNV
jgi:hypothetical protein